ncbi:MAG: hypothetical protein QOK22_2738 [Gaiellaceae bacterium]|nr:hypothetical protein [Gaiellaceae bacterium]
MSRYEFLLFAHVVSVIVWLGAGTTFTLIAIFGDRELMQRLGPLGRRLGPRVFAPASAGTLVFGILLVLDGSWTFDPLWIKLGFAGFATSFVVNVLVRAPIARRMGKGTLDPRRGGRMLGELARFELTVLYLTVADMLASRPPPTGGRWWSAARSSPSSRSRQRSAPCARPGALLRRRDGRRR